MPIPGPEMDALNRKVNTLVGLKQYQHIKKVMKEFDDKVQQETEKAPKVDQKQ